MTDVRHIALSGKQILAILLLMAAGILALVARAVDDNQPADKVLAFRWHVGEAAAACGLLSAALFIWHSVNVRRPDLHPDILSALFGEAAVSELNALHFVSCGRQVGARVRVLLFVQNVFDGPCTGRIFLTPIGTTTRVADSSRPHAYEIRAAEVVVFWRDLPLPVPHTAQLSFEFEHSVRLPRAPRVRFKRRVAVRTGSVSTALTVATLAAGHIGFHGGSRLNIPLAPVNEDPTNSFAPSDWMTISLWNPQDPPDMESIRKLVQQLIN